MFYGFINLVSRDGAYAMIKTKKSRKCSFQFDCVYTSKFNNGTSELYAGGGGSPVIDWHSNHGGVEMILVASCYRNRDRLWSDGPLGSYADLTFARLESDASYETHGVQIVSN